MLPLPWPDSPEEVWVQFYDVAVPMRPYLDSFSREERAAAFERGAGHAAAESHAGPYGTNGGDELNSAPR